MRSDATFATLLMIVGQLPLFVVWLVGLILAIVRWSRHPRVSGFVLIAMFTAAGTSFGGQIIFRLLPRFLEDMNLPQIFPLISAGMSVLYAVAWACMLFAAFGDRKQAASDSPFGQQYELPPKRPSIDKNAP